MDPNEAWSHLNDDEATGEQRALAALHLLEWLAKDGFGPDGVPAPKVVGTCVGVLLAHIDQVVTA